MNEDINAHNSQHGNQLKLTPQESSVILKSKQLEVQINLALKRTEF